MPINVSVVIPAYNAQKEIVKTISSILNQTYTDYEIIVVNDGSTDGTLEVLEQFSNQILVIDQSNAGVSKARNVGIKASKGKYIAFLDSDDLWHPSKLAVQIELMDKNPLRLASYTATHFQDATDFEKKGIVSSSTYMEKSIRDIFKNPYLVTSSFIINNEFCQSIDCFNENLPTAEDIDLYLRTSNKGTIGYISEVLTWKADIEGSLGSLLSSYEDNLWVIEQFLENNPELHILLSQDIDSVKAKIYHNWGKDLLWINKPMQALPVLFKAQSFIFKFERVSLIMKAMMKLILLPFAKKN